MRYIDKLTEDFNLLFEFGRSEDLAEWNKVQYKLWLELVSKGVVQLEDVNAFSKFGAYFYSYYSSKNKIPTVKEVKKEIF